MLKASSLINIKPDKFTSFFFKQKSSLLTLLPRRNLFLQSKRFLYGRLLSELRFTFYWRIRRRKRFYHCQTSSGCRKALSMIRNTLHEELAILSFSGFGQAPFPLIFSLFMCEIPCCFYYCRKGCYKHPKPDPPFVLIHIHQNSPLTRPTTTLQFFHATI